MVKGNYYAFPDEEDKRICWMVPVTSKIEKFERKYQKSIERYGICDVVSFGYLNGNKNAFAIQNMCPVTEKYILNEYVNSNTNCPVFIPNDLKREINAKVRKIIRLHKKGVSLAFADIISMREVLLKELDLEKSK